jgi:hypothetical protein
LAGIHISRLRAALKIFVPSGAVPRPSCIPTHLIMLETLHTTPPAAAYTAGLPWMRLRSMTVSSPSIMPCGAARLLI